MKKPSPDFLVKDEFEKILSSIRTANGEWAVRNQLMVKVMFNCGLRVSEVVNLQLKDIDYEGGFLHILEGKGKKDRDVPIQSDLLDLLQIYIKSNRGQTAPYYKYDPIFLNKGGKKLTTRRIGQIVSYHAKRSGIKKHIHPHTFRHSFAMHSKKCNIDTKTLQQVLGHESIQTTEVYLNHLQSKEEVKKAYEKFK